MKLVTNDGDDCDVTVVVRKSGSSASGNAIGSGNDGAGGYLAETIG